MPSHCTLGQGGLEREGGRDRGECPLLPQEGVRSQGELGPPGSICGIMPAPQP